MGKYEANCGELQNLPATMRALSEILTTLGLNAFFGVSAFSDQKKDIQELRMHVPNHEATQVVCGRFQSALLTRAVLPNQVRAAKFSYRNSTIEFWPEWKEDATAEYAALHSITRIRLSRRIPQASGISDEELERTLAFDLATMIGIDALQVRSFAAWEGEWRTISVQAVDSENRAIQRVFQALSESDEGIDGAIELPMDVDLVSKNGLIVDVSTGCELLFSRAAYSLNPRGVDNPRPESNIEWDGAFAALTARGAAYKLVYVGRKYAAWKCSDGVFLKGNRNQKAEIWVSDGGVRVVFGVEQTRAHATTHGSVYEQLKTLTTQFGWDLKTARY